MSCEGEEEAALPPSSMYGMGELRKTAESKERSPSWLSPLFTDQFKLLSMVVVDRESGLEVSIVDKQSRPRVRVCVVELHVRFVSKKKYARITRPSRVRYDARLMCPPGKRGSIARALKANDKRSFSESSFFFFLFSPK